MEKAGIKKIAVLGAESTGKSWLCERLAAQYHTVWVPEFAREYFNDSDIYNYSLKDLEIIAKRQLEMETAALQKASRILFCDTNLITLKIWAELEFEQVPSIILEGIQQSHYDLLLLNDNSQVWQEDPLRQNKFSREQIFDLNLAEIRKCGQPFVVVNGVNESKLANAMKAVDELLR